MNASRLLSFARYAVSAACLAAAAHAAAQTVGTVTLHIGQAVVVAASGASEPVRLGTAVHPGDRIETSEGGHVHIRFIDNALVSVRPTSRLIIEDYQFNAANIAQSLVRFRLEKGVMRAISGAAAEGAKERFRLNTPLVAIGVRGTDFVVRTQDNQTVALVNQGAIIMTPFGEGCSPQSFAPCGTSVAKLLSADMGNMLIEFRHTQSQPEIRPLNGMKIPDIVLAPEAAPTRDAGRTTARNTGDEAFTAALVKDMVRQAVEAPVIATVVAAPATGTATTVTATAVTTVTPTPITATPVVPQVVTPPQLAWGRWATAKLDATDFSTDRTLARQGRTATVGDNDFLLYRTENGTATLPQGLGSVSFDLQQAHARFTTAALEVQSASVQGGSLSIDFGSRLFNTSLNLSSAATGKVDLQASGTIRDDGIFISRSNTQSVAGATALDGKSAGYLFEKAAAGGTLSGITLWSR